MRSPACLAIPLLTLLVLGTAASAAEPGHVWIDSSDPAVYRITVPESAVVLSVPRGHLRIMPRGTVGATASPVYFFLADPDKGVNVSGWIEPAEKYVSLAPTLRAEFEEMKKRGFPAPIYFSPLKVDPWPVAISYGYVIKDALDSNIRASYVDHGTWIDLHVSAIDAARGGHARAAALALFESLRVTVKPGNPVAGVLREAVAAWAKPDPLPSYVYALTDLNGDGIPDAIVLITDSAYCGSGGCVMAVFRGTPNGFVEVSSSTISRQPVYVLAETRSGWHSLSVLVAGGGIMDGWQSLMRFNGKRYPGNPSMQPHASPAQLENARKLHFHP